MTQLSEEKQPIETPTRPPSPQHQFGTRAVHAGADPDPTTGAVIEPVCWCFISFLGGEA